MKQRANPKLGAFIVTVSEVMAWVGILNFVVILLLGWDSYQQRIVHLLPWMNIWWVLLFAVIPVGAFVLFALLVLNPSRQKYLSEQGYRFDSPQKIDHESILENQRKIMDKLGIND
jgi:hypothetical protein